MHIREYPELIVTCILTGDPDYAGLSVAVVFSESGCPYISDGEIIGNEATDDEYVMGYFKDLFEEFHRADTWEEPHSGEGIELSIEYSFPFYEKWMKPFNRG